MLSKLKFLLCFLIFSLPCLAEEPSLLKNATRIAPLSGTDIRYLNGRVYCWATKDKLLILRDKARKGNANFTQICLRDVVTKKEIYLEKISKWFNKSAAGLTDVIEMSSDGKWLLWVNDVAENGYKYGTYGCKLDGTKRFQLFQFQESIAWIPDSSKWLAIDTRKKSHMAIVQVRGLDGKVQSSIRFKSSLIDSDGLDSVMLTKQNNELYWLFLTDSNETNKVKIIKWKLGKRSAPVQTISIPFPSDTEVDPGFPQLSPDGKQIAWVADRRNNAYAKSIWISDLDGSMAREIGQLTTSLDETATFALGVRWVPDGKHLSFVYKNAIWTVPVSKPQ